MTKKELQEELKQSMLARDTERTAVLRLIISAIGYQEIQKGGAGYEASEEDVMNVLQNQAKQRRDSISEFEKGNRPDLVEKEQKELDLLAKYLPAQMSEDEIKEVVKQAISETGASSMQDMGKLMGNLMPKVKGKADGNTVNRIVREELSS